MSSSKDISQQLMDELIASQVDLQVKMKEFNLLKQELERLSTRAATDPSARRQLEKINTAMDGVLGKEILGQMDGLTEKAKELEKQVEKLNPKDAIGKTEKKPAALKKAKRNFA